MTDHNHPQLVAKILDLLDLRKGADPVDLVERGDHVPLALCGAALPAEEDAHEGHVEVDLVMSKEILRILFRFHVYI